MKLPWGSTLKAWLASRKGILFCLLFAGLLFPLLEFLYYGSVRCTAYGMIVFTFCMLLAGIVDFLLFYRKHCLLSLADTAGAFYDTPLPAPSGQIEKDYQNLLHSLYQQLNRTSSEAEQKSSLQLEYYTTWVHQIKTPISALRLLLQQEKQKGMKTSQMEQELFKIEQYSNMVLQYLRIEDMHNDLVLTDCHLDRLVKQVIRKYSSLFILKKLALKYEEIEQTVLTDEKWLAVIIEQILSNALKYTNEGYIHIFFDPADNALVIEDTGIGILPEDAARIFERGFTGQNGRVNGQATGLGLFLCKRAADRLGHRLSVTSEVGKGTSVRILFSMKRLEVFE